MDLSLNNNIVLDIPIGKNLTIKIGDAVAYEIESLELLKLLSSIETQAQVYTTAMAKEVIVLFNHVMGKKRGIELNDYRKRTILARIREGKKMKPIVGPEQFKAVFEHKKKQAELDPDSFKPEWLTIETLCAAKHFFKYLDEARDEYRKKLNKPVQRGFNV